MITKKFFICLTAIAIGVLSISNEAIAGKIDWDSLKKKADDYQKKHTGGQNTKVINNIAKAPPTKRDISGLKNIILTKEDKRHCKGHMKLANRHYLKKDYDKSIKSLNKVFERQPDIAGGRFMRAIIAARKKNYLTAWQNIMMAKSKDPTNKLIISFISKLEKVNPKPQNLRMVEGIYRPSPTYACEMLSDVFERILQEKVSENITSILVNNFESIRDNTIIRIHINSSAAIPEEELSKKLELFSYGSVKEKRLDDKKKSFDFKLDLGNIPLKNKNVRPVAGLREFLKFATDKTDIAISDSIERDGENKILHCTYSISVKHYKNLADFFRMVSPYAHSFKVNSLKLAFVPNSSETMWVGKIEVAFQTE